MTTTHISYKLITLFVYKCFFFNRNVIVKLFVALLSGLFRMSLTIINKLIVFMKSCALPPQMIGWLIQCFHNFTHLHARTYTHTETQHSCHFIFSSHHLLLLISLNFLDSCWRRPSLSCDVARIVVFENRISLRFERFRTGSLFGVG